MPSSLFQSFPLLLVKDPKSSYLTERHLQAIWLEQKYIKNLVTNKGKLIQVLSPGIWNTGAGPDFLKAHLLIDSQEFKGDIEIHLEDESWYHHQHQCDPLYNQVILHLSYAPSKQSPLPLIKENGEQILTAYLESALTCSANELKVCIDLELYPYHRFTKEGQCAHQLFSQLPHGKTQELFRSAAYWRLEKKTEHMQRYVSTVNMQFLTGIVRALGYKHNAEAFLELFLFLWDYRDLSQEELLAIAFGCCGFFEPNRHPDWQASPYYQALRMLWWERNFSITHQTSLRLDRIRPLNHPARRLVYLVKLLQDLQVENLWQRLLALWNPSIQPRKLELVLLDSLPTYTDSYWNIHYTFEQKARLTYVPLIGKTLKQEILLNVYLPLLYRHLHDKHPDQLLAFQAFYSSLKAPATQKGTYLTYRFFGQNTSTILKQADMLQGAYQLHKDFCIHFEASCEGCPFVERYKQTQF